MSLGQLLALVVLFAVLLSFVVPLPGWITMACIGMLAIAMLTSGVVIFRRGGTVAALLLVLACTALPAYAEDGGGMALPRPGISGREVITWDEAEDGGIPKGVVGADGIRCIGVSTNGELTYRNIGYIGADAGEMADNPVREQAWQREHCQNMQELQHGWFWDKRGLPHQAVKITIQRV